MDKQSWKLHWSDDLRLGIPEIDREHLRFIELVNAFNEAVTQRMELAVIEQRLLAIIEDARQHFAHEEELFRKWHYPDTPRHAHLHASLIRTLEEGWKGLGDGTPDYLLIEFGLKVKEALIEHILQEDMQYRDHFRSLPL